MPPSLPRDELDWLKDHREPDQQEANWPDPPGLSVAPARHRTDLDQLASERDDAEAQAQALQARLLLLADSVGEPVLLLDARDRVCLINQPAQRLIPPSLRPLAGGAALADVLARGAAEGWYDAAGSDPVAYAALWIERLDRGEPHWRWRLADGAAEWDVRHTPTPDGHLLTFSPVARAELTPERLRQLHAHLRQAQKMEAIGRLAGSIAHEFTTVLASIQGYASFLTEDLEPNSELHDYARQIAHAGARAQSLISRMLAFSRQEHSVRTTVDLCALVRDVVGAQDPAGLECERIQVQLTAPDTALCALVNTEQMSDAIDGLLRNALLATSAGGIVAVHVDVLSPLALEAALAAPGDHGRGQGAVEMLSLPDGSMRLRLGDPVPGSPYIRIAITDSGVGMSRALMDRLLDPYFTTRGVEGDGGVSLASVQGIVMAHDGALLIQSHPGSGTQASMLLPLSAPLVLQPAAHEAAAQEAAVRGGSERLLLVDDEPVITAALSEALVQAGYEVVCCHHAAEAIEALEIGRDRFQLILTDQTMPDITGFELLRYAKRRHPLVPVILCTGAAEGLEGSQARQAGAAALLNKPLSRTLLMETVRQVLDSTLTD